MSPADRTFERQKREIEARGEQWCDAEHCDDDNCRKVHIHHPNCRCPDCCAADDES